MAENVRESRTERRGALAEESMDFRNNRQAGRVDPRDPNRRQYYEDYGMVLPQGVYAETVEEERLLDERIAEAQGRLEDKYSELDEAYNQGRDQLSNVQNPVPEWEEFKSGNLSPIYIKEMKKVPKEGYEEEEPEYEPSYGGSDLDGTGNSEYEFEGDPTINPDSSDNYEWKEVISTYYFPPEAIDNLLADEEFPYKAHRNEDGSLTIDPYDNEEIRYFIDEQNMVPMSYQTQVNDLKDAFATEEEKIYASFVEQAKVANEDFNRQIQGARTALEGDYDTGLATLEQYKTELEQKRTEKQEYKSLLRKRYQDKLSRIASTLQGLQ